MSEGSDDLLSFVDDTPVGSEVLRSDVVWNILIVDDAEDVHIATTLALKSLPVLGRPLRFIHAYSARQAREVFAARSDVAVVLLDVVMESPEAGLELVRHIRDELKNDTVRIVLRTGQPGYAPEIDTINQYDINDYKTKSELTRTRLYTTLAVALRSYQQICTLRQSQDGLALIVSGSTELGRQRGVATFAQGVVLQLSALIGVPPEGLICAQAHRETDQLPTVVAAAGKFKDLINQPINRIEAPHVQEALTLCLSERRNDLQGHCCLYFSTASGHDMVAYVDAPPPLEIVSAGLLEVFCSSISVALENVHLYGKLLAYAYEDSLLGIPNRLSVVQAIDNKSSSVQDQVLALVDIDDFSGINTALGSDVGDDVLRAVSSRLQSAFSDNALVGRVGSDVFAILGPIQAISPAAVGEIFSVPIPVARESLRVTASCGFVALTDGTRDGVAALKNASLAVKKAKQSRIGGSVEFSEEMSIQARERMRLLHALRNAFDENGLFVMYQPQVDMSNGQATGAEALVRWRRADGHFVPPDQFIPVAEQSGLIVALGEFVLRTALFDLARLLRQGLQAFRISVNVSQHQIREPGFVDLVCRALKAADVDPAFVELEVTESAASENIDWMMAVFGQLRSLGVSIAIDDFGTGYSSLSMLNVLRPDRLKIDKAFVRPLGGQATDSDAIASMVIGLTNILKMSVIAEGVETVEQSAKLQAMGCVFGQGYLFAKPLPVEQLESWLRDKGAFK